MTRHWRREVGMDWILGQGMVASHLSVTLQSSWTVTQYKKMVRNQGSWLAPGHDVSFQSQPWLELAQLLSQGSERKEGSCYYWAANHYRTFDGNIISLPQGCEHILVTEPRDNTIKVSVLPQPSCSTCMKIRLVLETDEFILAADESGRLSVVHGSSSLSIPGRHGGVVFQVAGDWLFVEILGLGFTLRWNAKVRPISPTAIFHQF